MSAPLNRYMGRSSRFKVSGFRFKDRESAKTAKRTHSFGLWRFLYRYHAATDGFRSTFPRFLRNEPIPKGKGQDERDGQEAGTENYQTNPPHGWQVSDPSFG